VNDLWIAERTCEDWMRDASLFDIWFLSDIVVVSGLV
jgi:hypothetical protein